MVSGTANVSDAEVRPRDDVRQVLQRARKRIKSKGGLIKNGEERVEKEKRASL